MKTTTYTLNTNGESVTLTGRTRDLGHGKQLEVIYSDGSLGFEHVDNFVDIEEIEGNPHIETLRSLAENGFIVHNAYNGEEWLTDMEENWIFLGIGNTSDWEDAEGVQYEEEVSFPGDNATVDVYPGYFQKNKDVSNPVDEHEGWEEDFVLDEDNIRIRNPY